MRNPFRKKKCVKCEIQERELQYLRTLVDRLLVKNDIAPVEEEPFDVEAALEIEQSKDGDGKEKNVEIFGD